MLILFQSLGGRGQWLEGQHWFPQVLPCQMAQKTISASLWTCFNLFCLLYTAPSICLLCLLAVLDLGLLVLLAFVRLENCVDCCCMSSANQASVVMLLLSDALLGRGHDLYVGKIAE